MHNTALIVLGMHRSGTSLLSGLLAQLGVAMGRNLYAAQAGVNEKGFWEHGDIVDTHDELLLHLSSQWDDFLPLSEGWQTSEVTLDFQAKLKQLLQRDFAQTSLWALKDPRMCRLLPLWFPLFESLSVTPRFIYMNRNPLEVVGSLQKRDGFSKEKALLLWLDHSLRAERYSRSQVRVFIDFNQVVQAPVATLEQIQTSLKLDLPTSIEQAQHKIQAFVSPNLRHHQAQQDEIQSSHLLTALAARLHQLLNQATTDDTTLHQAIDQIAAELANYQQSYPLELLEQIRYLNQERADYKIKFFQIYTARTWRATKLLWWAEKCVRGIK